MNEGLTLHSAKLQKYCRNTDALENKTDKMLLWLAECHRIAVDEWNSTTVST